LGIGGDTIAPEVKTRDEKGGRIRANSAALRQPAVEFEAVRAGGRICCGLRRVAVGQSEVLRRDDQACGQAFDIPSERPHAELAHRAESYHQIAGRLMIVAQTRPSPRGAPR
jgi:hypothetical protein